MYFQSHASVFKFLCSVDGGTERERERERKMGEIEP